MFVSRWVQKQDKKKETLFFYTTLWEEVKSNRSSLRIQVYPEFFYDLFRREMWIFEEEKKKGSSRKTHFFNQMCVEGVLR